MEIRVFTDHLNIYTLSVKFHKQCFNRNCEFNINSILFTLLELLLVNCNNVADLVSVPESIKLLLTNLHA